MMPGTLALATVRTVPGVLVMAITDGERAGWLSPHPVRTFTFHALDQVTAVRPLTVADVAEDHLAALAALLDGTATPEQTSKARDLLDLLTNARKDAVKPPEPLDRGAVVTDADGRAWVRASPSGVRRGWVQFETRQVGISYDQIAAIRVEA